MFFLCCVCACVTSMFVLVLPLLCGLHGYRAIILINFWWCRAYFIYFSMYICATYSEFVRSQWVQGYNFDEFFPDSTKLVALCCVILFSLRYNVLSIQCSCSLHDYKVITIFNEFLMVQNSGYFCYFFLVLSLCYVLSVHIISMVTKLLLFWWASGDTELKHFCCVVSFSLMLDFL